MRRFVRPTIALLLAATGLACRGVPAPAPPEADTGARRSPPAGDLVGFVGAYGSYAWLGIPYAKPPVGELRWRAPQPPERWSGTRDALAFGPRCSQIASRLDAADGVEPGTPTGQEDCLYLNVYAPQRTGEASQDAAGLPVLFWIHGGGNVIGSADFYDGGHLAQAQDVVVVTINYRLGPLGWMRHAALRSGSDDPLDRSGNFGTLDQIRALEWVRDNVAAFGGDPGNVTIFGESAGGTDVYMLILSPLARGLFQRAVVQSGGLRTSTPEEAENFLDDDTPGDRFSSNEILVHRMLDDERLTDRAEAKARILAMSDAETARQLRAIPADRLLELYGTERAEGLIDVPRLFAEGTVIPAEPALELLAAGRYNQVPLIAGTNRDESKLFMFRDPRRVRRVLWVFPRLRDPEGYELSSEYQARIWKATGVDEPISAMRRAQGPSVFAYRWDWDEEPRVAFADLSVMLGAAHALEIPFVFGHWDLGRAGRVLFDEDNAPGRVELSSRMMSYWAEMAYHGSPGRGRDGDLPEWKPWDGSAPQAPKFLVFDTDAGGGLHMSDRSETTAGVLASIASDPRLTTRSQRCTLYREVADWSPAFTRDDYPKAGDGCGDLPFDAYPWVD